MKFEKCRQICLNRSGSSEAFYFMKMKSKHVAHCHNYVQIKYTIKNNNKPDSWHLNLPCLLSKHMHVDNNRWVNCSNQLHV